ncbi:hypothetical protein TNCV_1970201 [Trichonephila clavipes]|nr:hypothetical protein TNCV_1970201 [Trichonephila clavipes]
MGGRAFNESLRWEVQGRSAIWDGRGTLTIGRAARLPLETELVLELDAIANVIEVVDLAGTVPYPSTGDDHSNNCCYADPFLQCSCEQRHLVPNEDVSNHGSLRKSESL